MNARKKNPANPAPKTASTSRRTPSAKPSGPSEADLQKELKECRAEVICLRAKFNPAEIEKYKIQTVTTEQMFQDALFNAQRDMQRYEQGASDNPLVKDLKEKLYNTEKENASLKKASKQDAEEITVLKRRCNSLETEYTKIKSMYDSVVNKLPSTDDLRILENDYKMKVFGLKKELEETKEKLKNYTQKLPDILSKRHDAETLQKELDETKKDRDSVRRQLAGLKKQLSAKEKDLADYMQERVTLKEALDKGKTEIEDLRSTNDILNKTVAQLKTDLTTAQTHEDHDASVSKSQISKLENELETSEQETERLRKILRALELELKQLRDENKTVRDAKTQLETEVKKLRDETESLSKEIQHQSEVLHERDVEIDQLQVKLSEGNEVYRSVDGRVSESDRDSELSRLQKECESLTILLASISKNHDKRQASDEESQRLKSDLKEMEKRHSRKSKELEAKLEKEKDAHARTKQEKDRLEMKCHDAFEKISQKEKKLAQLEANHKQLIERKDSTIKELRKEKTMVDPNANSKPDPKALEANNKKMFDQLEDMKRENSALRMRLSKASSSQLMDGNTDIADLGDPHRPELLVEQFSELYDNQWTEALESCEIECSSTQASVEKLLKALFDAYTFCKEQSLSLTKRVLTLFQSASNRVEYSQLPPKKLQTVRELLKRFAPDIGPKVAEEYMKRCPPLSARKDVSDQYIQQCVSVCWLMCIQNPPLVLDTTKPSGTFDDSIYRHFTKGGKTVDFLVWPPVRIQENGRLICKGIAQGK